MAMPTVFAKTNYIEDFGDYLDRSATRATTQGPIGFLGKLFTGKLNTFSRFKNALKTTVHSVLQTVKEATAWATVGLSIANERLGKLAWAMLPQSFRDPLPKIVKEHMDSTLGKLLDELRDQVNPLAETPKEDMRELPACQTQGAIKPAGYWFMQAPCADRRAAAVPWYPTS